MTKSAIGQEIPILTDSDSLSHQKRPLAIASPGTIVAFFLLFALLGLVAWGLVKSGRGPVDRGMAPGFSLTSFGGQTVTLSELRGQVVIVNFWASWCLPCREEAAYLEQTWRKYKDQGVVFIGVDYADTEPAALAYLKEFDITYFNGPDLGTRISQTYHIRGVPETFLITKSGELRGVQIGPLKSPQLDRENERCAGCNERRGAAGSFSDLAPNLISQCEHLHDLLLLL